MKNIYSKLFTAGIQKSDILSHFHINIFLAVVNGMSKLTSKKHSVMHRSQKLKTRNIGRI